MKFNNYKVVLTTGIMLLFILMNFVVIVSRNINYISMEKDSSRYIMEFKIAKNGIANDYKAVVQPAGEQIAEWQNHELIQFSNFLQEAGYNFDCQYDLKILADRLIEYFEIFNQAIPLDTIEPLWNADGPSGNKMVYENGGTHQVLAGRAIDYAANRFPDLFGGSPINCPVNGILTTEARRAFVRYSDWPDVPGSGERYPFIGVANFLGQWSNNRHFYNPNNGRNYFNDLIEPGMNARTRTEHFFNRAVRTYQGVYYAHLSYNNRRIQAITYLGKASHFLSDLASPVHTGNQLIIGWSWMAADFIALLNAKSLVQMAYYHTTFENIAQSELDRLANGQITDFFPVVNSNRFHAIMEQTTFSDRVSQLAHLVAVESYGHYSRVSNTGPLWETVSNATRREVAHVTLPLAVDANAAMLVQFAQAVGHDEESPPHFTDGTLLQNRGSIFVAAGGAPLFVTDWNRIGGFRPYINITDQQLRMMRRTPADGTLVWESTTNTTYVFAGGAPLFISNMNISGRPVTRVDFAALFNTASYLSRVNQHPADGTLVWEAVTNTTYIFAGGAPLFVTNLDLVGGYRPSTQVDFLALFTPSSHLSRVRSHPMDGTFVTTMQGSIFRFTNGQAFRINSWDEVGGIQHHTLVDEHAFAVYGRSAGVYVLTLNDLILQNWHLVEEFLLWELQNLGWIQSVRY